MLNWRETSMSLMISQLGLCCHQVRAAADSRMKWSLDYLSQRAAQTQRAAAQVVQLVAWQAKLTVLVVPVVQEERKHRSALMYLVLWQSCNNTVHWYNWSTGSKTKVSIEHVQLLHWYSCYRAETAEAVMVQKRRKPKWLSPSISLKWRCTLLNIYWWQHDYTGRAEHRHL